MGEKARVRSDLQVREQVRADLKTAASRKKVDTPQTHNSTLIKEAMHNFSEKEAAMEAELGRPKELGAPPLAPNGGSGPNRRSIVSRLSKFEPGAHLEAAALGSSCERKFQGQQTSKLGGSGRDDASSMYAPTALSARRQTNQKLYFRGKTTKGPQNASPGATGGGLMPIIESSR